MALRGKEGAHLTQLLWVRQVHAGTGVSFHSTAVRLETSIAVQHESQWSLQMDPRNQRLTVHWLRLVRDGRRIDHLQRERMRLIQRETQLERLVIDGTWTLIAVLDDVRPGDVIEAAYSIETAHPIRPGACEAFFAVPPQWIVGRYRLSVLSDAAHPDLAWKASADAPPHREEILPDGRRRWSWEGTQTAVREPEPNQPGSFLDYLWVQVSDLADWRELATRAAEAWARMNDDAGIETIAAFTRPEQVDAAAVARLIQHIQDEFRYLSLDLETGGWIPAAPGVVARRRYGDCKDLAWMAAVILRQWGLTARPVLVGAGLREQVASLLPMTLLFNHAVLEVEVAGEARWFDLTERAQGGDFSGQSIGWFGHGLPLDVRSDGLRAQPGKRPHGLYALRETLLLDTRGGETSYAEQRIRAEGWQADSLRQARQAHGAEEFSKERDQQAQRRYGKARRSGSLQWRDDRAKNVCELVEVFEIKDAVYPDESGQRALFDVPINLVLQAIALPEDKPRRTPWTMPFPLEIRHEITVKAGGMTPGSRRRRQWTELGFSASLDEPRLKGAWTKIVHFTVTAPEVLPDQLAAYRKQLEKFLLETGWRLYLPWGQPRMHRGHGFGVLPPVKEDGVASVGQAPAETRARPSAPVLTEAEVKLTSSGRRHRPRKETTFEIPAWAWRIGLCAIVGCVLGLLRACVM
jgi:transglutaminase-like putative cysteine protease